MKKKKTQPKDSDVLGRLSHVTEQLKKVKPEVLGQRVRRARDAQALSIRELADKAEVSKNSIVRLEQGRGTQAITVLKICSVLGLHVERLVEPPPDELLAVTHRLKDDHWFDMADMASKPLLNAKRAITAEQRRKAVEQGAQVPVNLLRCRLPGGKILPSILELHQASPIRSHVGEEFVYVLEGEAIVTIGKKKHRLKQGESLTFWSAEPHSYAPADAKKTPTRILSIRVDG